MPDRKLNFKGIIPENKVQKSAPVFSVIILVKKNYEKKNPLLAKRLVFSDKYFILGICVPNKKLKLIFDNNIYIYIADIVFAQ